MSPGLCVLSTSEDATLQVGRALAGGLRPGVVLALHGDLGTGKTVLSRGLARGLGISVPVTSPSFSVVQEYPRPDGTLFFHLDLYRIRNEAAALAFGIEEYLFVTDGITVVEWPERIEGLLAAPGESGQVLRVHLAHATETSRHIAVPAALAGYVRDLARRSPGLVLGPGAEDCR